MKEEKNRDRNVSCKPSEERCEEEKVITVLSSTDGSNKKKTRIDHCIQQHGRKRSRRTPIVLIHLRVPASLSVRNY